MFSKSRSVVIISFIAIACARHEYSPQLVEYIKTERELRSRIGEEQGLNDSIRTLQERYDIDLEEEFEKLSHEPEAWLNFLKEFKDAK